jgi:hypothetical protein
MTTPLPEDTVLVRTDEGHREVLAEDRDLDHARRRMLLLVNGYTPLGDLAERLHPEADWAASAWGLLEDGLVSRVDPEFEPEWRR